MVEGQYYQDHYWQDAPSPDQGSNDHYYHDDSDMYYDDGQGVEQEMYYQLGETTQEQEQYYSGEGDNYYSGENGQEEENQGQEGNAHFLMDFGY